MPRFRNLTSAQEDAFAEIAMGGNGQNRSPRTLKALVDAGLVTVSREQYGDGPFKIIAVFYEVPVAVHMEWCQWCSEHHAEG